jgi:branched-chain amino acid transport system ATP-binding protein
MTTAAPHTAPPRPAATNGEPPRLAVEHLEVNYGPSRALSDVSFVVPPGQVIAVLGTNGAGKSTLASSISGLVAPAKGRILVDGQDVTSLSAYRVARLGVAHVLEGHGVFPSLSVIENLRLGIRSACPRAQQGEALDRALELFPILADRRRQAASTLSGGERQMLALARVLAAPPRLLVADEVSLGLAPKLVAMVFDVLATARAAGVTIVLIEQFVERALELADLAMILRRGRCVWRGSADAAGATVLDQYLGVEQASAAIEAGVEAAEGEGTP